MTISYKLKGFQSVVLQRYEDRSREPVYGARMIQPVHDPWFQTIHINND